MIQFKPMAGTGKRVLRALASPAMFEAHKQAALLQVGQDLVRFAQTGIERQIKKGRVYGVKRKGGRKVLVPYRAGLPSHTASAPGQFPAILNGDVLRSIRFDKRGAREIEFGSTDPKAVWLENGTGRMKARPTLARAVKERQKNAFNYLKWMAKL